MTYEFSKPFMTTMGELLGKCIELDTDTLEIEFVSKSGIRWSVEMTFKVADDEECDG